MANAPDDDSGQRFGRDMRRIREERDVSVDTVHENTRIARTLIETFEETGLLDHPAFNRVYLRSFVRSYAETVGLPEDVALEGLDHALKGTYTNQLVVHALDEEPESPSGAAGEPERTDSNQETAHRSSSSGNGAGPEKGSTAGETAADATVPDEPPVSDPSTTEEEEGSRDDSSSQERSLEEEREHPRMATEGVSAGRETPSSSEDAERSNRSESSSSSRSTRSTDASRSTSFRQWIPTGLVVLVVLSLLGVGVWFAFREGTASDPAASDTSRTESADSLVRAGPTPVRPPPANISLGDTLHLTVIAESDVRGIRLRRDDDLRRPYWIDSSEATVFPFRDRVIVEEELGNVRLLLEGYPYPLARHLDAQGRVVITRDTAVAVADTLRGRPVSLDSPPDTNRVPTFTQ